MRLPFFNKGGEFFKEVTAEKLNQLADAIRQLVPTSSSTIMAKMMVNGVSYEIRRPRGGSAAATILPWDIIDLTPVGATIPATSYTAKVYPGTAGGLLPSNVLQEFTVGADLTRWICELVTDGKQITGCSISTDTSDPPPPTLVPNAIPASVKFVFALTLNGVAYRTIGIGNPLVSFNQWISTDKSSPPPFGIPGVDRWYQVLVS